MAKWIQTKFEGVRYREHPTRKHGVRKDRYYAIRYYVDGKRIEEPLGWETGWKNSHPEKTISLEQEAVARRAELMKNKKQGAGAVTLKEKRAEQEAKKEAEKAKIQAEIVANKTLSKYWEESYFPATKLSKKENSWEKEEQHFRIWIEPLLGALPLRSIGLDQWDELVKTLSAGRVVRLQDKTSKEPESGASEKSATSGGSSQAKEKRIIPSQRSREYITGTLRRILKHAHDRGTVRDLPPTGKRIGIAGPGNNRRLRVISYEEEQKIMECLLVVDLHAWRITRFAFLTGCRISEAFNLSWSGVDSSRLTITFPETKNRDLRTLPITKLLSELFEGMERGSPNSIVFTRQDGEPYLEAPSTFSTAVEKMELNENRSRLDRITFHSIRHTVATRLAQSLGPRDLMDIMGWRTVQMAMRYIHANENAKVKALSMLGMMPAGKVLQFRSGETREGA